MTREEALVEYLIRIGDNSLIMGHRMSEWCGHGPILEQDIAIINIALDHIGQAKNWLDLACEVEGKGRTSDDLAYHRDAFDYRNFLLCEQPNGNWGDTLVRGFFFDTWNYFFNQQLANSSDERIAAIAQKSLKEISYHKNYSADWMIRLGDSTEESHEKMQHALNELWMYTGELFMMDEVDERMLKEKAGADLSIVKKEWEKVVNEILAEATLQKPEGAWMQKGGKKGIHTEHLGYILAEMQFLPRAYPDAKW
jgi:ring-1,2-phenylacetyl-CoA epoxidase subunit PaaC